MDRVQARTNLILEQLESAKSATKGHRWRLLINHLAEATRHAAAAMEMEMEGKT